MKTLKLAVFFAFMLWMTSSAKAQFTNYTTGNSSLPSDFVSGGVVIDSSNNVWAGTDAGVAKFDGSNWTVFTTSNGLPSNNIASVAVDANNNVWIGTAGDGVAKYNGSTWTTYTYADGLCDNGIHFISSEPDGDMWFGSWGSGVSKLSGTTWTTYNASNGFPNDAGTPASVYYITVDASGTIWFATDMGLVKYDNTSFTLFNQTNIPELKNNIVMAVAVDDAYNKWLGIQYNGITKLNSSNTWVANYDSTSYGICDKGVNDIKIAADGNLWLGEYTQYGALIKGGITKFNPTSGTGVSYSTDGTFSDQVFRIAIDQNTDIWVATGNGLSKFHDAVGINENDHTTFLSFYPNPAFNYLKADCDIQSGTVQIFDMTGRIVSVQNVTSPVKINIENLEHGIYSVKIADKEKIYNGKFIKE